MNFSRFDERPIIVAIAGSNGSGKTTFYHAHFRTVALRYINADVLARELDIEPYAAAHMADELRREFARRKESFTFETVFSDTVGDKLTFLKEAAAVGYTVVLCFIGIAGPEVSLLNRRPSGLGHCCETPTASNGRSGFSTERTSSRSSSPPRPNPPTKSSTGNPAANGPSAAAIGSSWPTETDRS